jgi:hypothetical protein
VASGEWKRTREVTAILKWAEFWRRFRRVFLQNLVLGNEEEFCNPAVDEVVGLRERNTAICGDWQTELISRRNDNIKMGRLSILRENFPFQAGKATRKGNQSRLIPLVFPCSSLINYSVDDPLRHLHFT